jgi:hypothetical protein
LVLGIQTHFSGIVEKPANVVREALNTAPSGSIKREQRLEQLEPLSGFGASTDKIYPAELAARLLH